MRAFNIKLACFMVLLGGLIIIVGCGSQDLLDENKLRYRIDNMTFNDAQNDDLIQIDVARTECDNNVTLAGVFDSLQEWSGSFADITVVVETDAPGLTLTGYTIDYDPLESQALGVGLETPTDLDSIDDSGSFNISFPSGSTTTFTTTVMTLDTKAEYLNKTTVTRLLTPVDENGDGNPDYLFPSFTGWEFLEARYSLIVTLFFEDEFGFDRTLSASRTVWLTDLGCE